MALRDWLSGPGGSAAAVFAVPAVEDRREDRKTAKAATTATETASGIDTPTGAGMYHGQPTEEALDVADAILDHLAAEGIPKTEAAILEAVGGDETVVRGVLYRLAVEGIVKLARGSRYRLPGYQPKAPYLPADCPLRGGPVPSGCRFEPRLFRRMVKESVLPYPDGGCPLIRVCKLQTTSPRKGNSV